MAASADALLRARCEGAIGDRYGSAPRQRIWKRLDDELEMIRGLGYASYFLTVGDVTDLIREMGVRCAAAARAPAPWSTTCSASPGSTRSATAC